uniref:BUD13 homolog n=1 Tax=Anopheles christyi TaxID=43041 RepID=A0A182KA45_9DIPT
MATKIDQKEYLKRYLSNDKDKKKKKKKKDKHSAAKKGNVVIVDDDLDLTALQSRIDDNETDLFGLDEEAPQVVGIIDERPPELRAREDFSSAKWKALNANNDFDAMLRADEGMRTADAENRVTFKDQGEKNEQRRKYDSDESPPRQNNTSRKNRGRKDSDESPPRRRGSEEKDISIRRRKRDGSDESPPRKSVVSKSTRKNRDSDESPPRGRRSKEKEVSRRKKRIDDSDESPPRKSAAGKSTRNNQDSDESPPRKRRSKEKHMPRTKTRKEDSEESPPRKSAVNKGARKNRDSDESPPRRRRSKEHNFGSRKERVDDSEKCPPGRKTNIEYRKQTYDSDGSPPRKHRQHDSDESPPRQRVDKELEKRRKRHDSEESPVRGQRDKEHRERDRRQIRRRSNDSDESPPRRSKNTTNESEGRLRTVSDKRERSKKSPTERESRRYNDSDESPPRRRQNNIIRHSSSRYRQVDKRDQPTHSRVGSPPVRIKQERKSSDSDLSPPRKSTARSARDESPPRRKRSPRGHRQCEPSQLEQRIKQEPRSPSTSRRHDPTEKMTKTLDGKRAGLQDAKSLREENEKHRAREREALMKLTDEASGRYAETVVREKGGRRRDVEKELREELAKRKQDEKKKEIYSRWGKGVKQVEDYKAQLEEAAREMEKPLARYADDKDLDEYLKEQEREGDPMLEYLRSKRKEENKRAGIPEKPVYEGAFPDNRYGIRPGYRWDGVDRSNGFEKRWFETMSKKKAVEEEAYKYSVEDM